ncbi:fucolectin-like [Branchiostoma floridae x Branchiostoma japonicum]
MAQTAGTLNNMAETGLPEMPEFNIAEGKTAFQTSTQGYHTPATGAYYSGEAGLAVDGNTNGIHRENSCTHTKGEANPAWWVDLGQSYMIKRVEIYNRLDCCSERLNPFNIHIGSSSTVTSNPKCGSDHQIDLSQPSISVSCQGMTGRYVGVRLPGSRTLTLCEVQVFSDSVDLPKVRDDGRCGPGFPAPGPTQANVTLTV